MKCKTDGCSTELRTIAAQSSGVCPRCESAARDRARADALARDALAELLDVDPSVAKVLAMPLTAADTWGATTFQASIGTTRRGLASVTFVGVATGDGHSPIGDRSYEVHEDVRGAFDAVRDRLQQWADRHGLVVWEAGPLPDSKDPVPEEIMAHAEVCQRLAKSYSNALEHIRQVATEILQTTGFAPHSPNLARVRDIVASCEILSPDFQKRFNKEHDDG